MISYTNAELKEALRAIASLLAKCEHSLPGLKENSAQQTLLRRRIKALQMAISLLEREASSTRQMG